MGGGETNNCQAYSHGSCEHPFEKDAVPAPVTGKREASSQGKWST